MKTGSVSLGESPENVLCSLADIRSTCVIGKELLQWDLCQLGGKQVDLVHEQDNRRPEEPATVDDRLEQNQTLCHPILFAGVTNTKKEMWFSISRQRERERVVVTG